MRGRGPPWCPSTAPWRPGLALHALEVQLDGVPEHLFIQVQAKLCRPHGAELPEHDILRHTPEIVLLSELARRHQDVHCLLEAAAHKGARVLSVDAVPGDGHEMAAVGHHIAQNCDVAVVHVRAVELNHVAELGHQGQAGCLDAEHLDDLDDVVRSRAGMVDPLVWEHIHQVYPLRVQHPLRGGGETAFVRRHRLLGLPQSDLADVRHSLQLELAQHRLLDAL